MTTKESKTMCNFGQIDGDINISAEHDGTSALRIITIREKANSPRPILYVKTKVTNKMIMF